MSAGQAFEALNNAGVEDANLLVILNDNDMSISPPVGALNKYLARLLSGRTFNAARRVGERVLKGMPSVLEFASPGRRSLPSPHLSSARCACPRAARSSSTRPKP